MPSCDDVGQKYKVRYHPKLPLLRVDDLLRMSDSKPCRSNTTLMSKRNWQGDQISRTADKSPTATMKSNKISLTHGLLNCVNDRGSLGSDTSSASPTTLRCAQPAVEQSSFSSNIMRRRKNCHGSISSINSTDHSTDTRKKRRWSRSNNKQKIWQRLKDSAQNPFRSRSKTNLDCKASKRTSSNAEDILMDHNVYSSEPDLARSTGVSLFGELRNNIAAQKKMVGVEGKDPTFIRKDFDGTATQRPENTRQSQQESDFQSLRVSPNRETSMPTKSFFQILNRRTVHKSVYKKRDKRSAKTTTTIPNIPLHSNDSANHYVAYLLNVHLKDGKDMVIRDASGSSDPYVKFKYKGKLIYRSNTVYKNLNPTWEESFSQLIEDRTDPLQIEVFDFDWLSMDDFMGSAEVDLSQLTFSQPFDVKLLLNEEKCSEYMGYLNIQLTIVPQTEAQKNLFLQKSMRTTNISRKTTPTKLTQSWSSVVNIVLVEARNLLPTESNNAGSTAAQLPNPFVKFKLGTEKYKSKNEYYTVVLADINYFYESHTRRRSCYKVGVQPCVHPWAVTILKEVAEKSLEPKWLEQFDLHIYDENNSTLQLMILDKKTNLFMGRCAINLTEMDREVTHQRWFELEDGAGSILILLSITGISGPDSVTDIHLSEMGPEYRRNLEQKYAFYALSSNVRDVGRLTVKVFRAQGLASADIGGKSDPFCVLELVNTRLQTHTEYKTLNPHWNQLFTFNVKDIHSVLEITVFDEDPNKKVEFLGKVGIPLTKIRNGEKRWYVLKDRKLLSRAKGQILLELELHFNQIKAAIRTFNPKEQKLIAQEPKFKRMVLMNNVQRIRLLAQSAIEFRDFLKTCVSWESRPRSLTAFICFMLMTYCFELYLLPLCLILLFVKSYIINGFIPGRRICDNQVYFDSDDEDDSVDDKNNRSTSLKERFTAAQDALTTVQNALDFVASLMERVRNTFNFTTPWLSWLAIFMLAVATIVLYLIPLRWIIMAWGVKKFSKKLISNKLIDNNEMLDFLSRVPCDKDIASLLNFKAPTVGRDTHSDNSTTSSLRFHSVVFSEAVENIPKRWDDRTLASTNLRKFS